MKKLKITPYIILFFFGLIMPSNSFAQDYTISGSLISDTNDAIAYANVIVILETDSTIVTGASTNEKGVFTINSVKRNKYLLKASYVGYEAVFKAVNITSDLILDPIVLKESAEALGEVVFTLKKPTLKKEVDRLIFNIENSALSEGNMLEVIRSTPGVLVLDNAITVKNATPTVYINDRKVNLSGDELAQLLEGSSANTIKSIEVITSPPAKYDAESGVVLNIVMSKNLITGYRGNVLANYSQGVFPRYNAGMSHFYKTEKINISANYNYTQEKINRRSIEDINYINNGILDQHWVSNTNRDTRSKTHNFNLNFDYFLSDLSTLSFSANALYVPYFEHLTNAKTFVNNAENVSVLNFDSNNSSKDNKHNIGLDMDFVHDFKNEAKLSANVHYTTYDYNRQQDVISNYFSVADGAFDTAFNTSSNQNTNIVTSKVDYSIPTKPNSGLSLGVKTSFINTESDITLYDIINGNAVFNPLNSDVFDYDESIYAGYFGYEEDFDAFSFSAGMRVEQTEIKGVSQSTGQSNKQNYFEWFPTLNLSHKITENTDIYLNYKRSVQRPNYKDLNPFRYFLNDNTIVTGNPNLMPSFTNHYVLGASIKDMYSIEAYYKNTDGRFIELPNQDNINNQFVFIPTNLKSSKEFGLDLSVYFNLTDDWFIYAVTSFYNTEDEARIGPSLVKKDTWSNYSVLSNDLSFLKDKSLTANFTLTYIHKNIQGLQEVKTRIATDLSVKKSIFKKKGTLSLVAADLLNEQDYTVSTKYLNQNNSRYFNLDNRYVKLGFSYKFGNTKLKTNERIIDQKERERLKAD